MSTIYLGEIWQDINRTYWGGRLPTPEWQVEQPMLEPAHAWSMRHLGGRFTLRLHPDITRQYRNAERTIADTLLHESIHVGLRQWIGVEPFGHGFGFRREARRIGRAMGLPAPRSATDFRTWPQSVRPAAYYDTIEIGAPL